MVEQPGVAGPLPGSCRWRVHLRGWWGRPRRKKRRRRKKRKVAATVQGGAGVDVAPCLGVAFLGVAQGPLGSVY